MFDLVGMFDLVIGSVSMMEGERNDGWSVCFVCIRRVGDSSPLDKS